ncbi:hypothetical protein V8D89_001760 [Ganoderma adspersum]
MLRPNKGLRALSSTCRWIREASAPILFRSCYQLLGLTPWKRLEATYEILPFTLWSHVRSVDRPSLVDDAHVGRPRILRLSCFCPAYSQKNPSIVDPLLCNAFNTVDAALPALSRLTTLHLHVQYIDVHGLSWNNMETILSLPSLRHLHIDRLYICPELLDGDNPNDSTITPLITFHYTLPHYRQPWSFPSELTVLDFLVRKLHTSLSSLVLPVESAPIQTISSLDWPQLREFTLRGERWSDPATPIVTLFSSMASLRSLTLELSEPENTVPSALWPKGRSAAFSWPNLETLRVSHPDPADEIYHNLPSSVRALSLRSWPHQCIQIYDENQAFQPLSWHRGRKQRRWNCPLLTPCTLVQVLQKCEFSLLPTLELEYRVDAHESELLRTLAVNFRHLTTLEVHRYRSPGTYDVAVTDFAEALAPLTSLRLLKLHLDFAYMPGPKPGSMMARLPPDVGSPTFDDTLASAAEQLSRTLAPSLEEIWMFKYEYEPLWAVFVVTRASLDGELQIGVVQQGCRKY